ncbi:MAG: hypothetical protein J6K84_05895 [Oscillospiraceae bacterium]|nr:hypothetical protein [Oscillospiraceae bacterium]
MQKYSLKRFQDIVKIERQRAMAPYELVYKGFISLGYNQRKASYFFQNASAVVEALRDFCWNNFVPEEERFSSDMLKKLIDDSSLDGLSAREAIESFIDSYPQHIYQLCLSNTQSRRSRAGKEFEAIIELLLMGAGIPMDTQGNIGKKVFIEKSLGKLVDIVSPGVVEYVIDKNYTSLISAKTTLRERWQEVPEEMNRTGAREMFLATLDDSVTTEVLNTLYEANIRIVTTKRNKQENYATERRVIDFETLLGICSTNQQYWSQDTYNDGEKEAVIVNINKQIEKHRNHEFVCEYYKKRKEEFEK